MSRKTQLLTVFSPNTMSDTIEVAKRQPEPTDIDEKLEGEGFVRVGPGLNLVDSGEEQDLKQYVFVYNVC